MTVNISVDLSKFNKAEILKKVGPSNNALGSFMASTWWKLYTPYVPMQTGALFQTVLIKPFEITHEVPYANRQYNGNFNFRTNKHPLATMKWDEAAISAGKDKILASDTEKFIKSGGAGI